MVSALGGDRQNVAAGVIDGAPVSRHHRPPCLLVHSLALQFLMPGDLQVEQPENSSTNITTPIRIISTKDRV